MPEDFEGPEGSENLDKPPSFFPYGEEVPSKGHVDFEEFVAVQVHGVFSVDGEAKQRSLFVMLSDGERKLSISIGPFEAQAISLPLESSTPDRPMTHDLCKTLIEKLGGTLQRVLIDDLWNGVYYAKLVIQKGKEMMEIDARPSDALALAVRFEVPIFVIDSILEKGDE